MFIDNPDARRTITPQLRDEIVELRKKNEYSANYFAKNILNRPQSWISQIETGKTKTINCSDLILLFSSLLSLTDEETEKYLVENYDRLFNNGSKANTGKFKENVSLFDEELADNDKKLREQYQEHVDNIVEGLNFFYDHVESKENAIKVMKRIRGNMHYDLGFSLSVAALPLLAIRDSKKKKEVFESMLDLIKQNGDFSKSHTEEPEDVHNASEEDKK